MVTPGKNGKKKHKGQRRIDFVDLLIAFILFLILFLVFTVVLVMAYPGAARIAADNILSPAGRTGKVLTKVGNRAREGFLFRVKPFVSGLESALAGSELREEKPVKAIAVVLEINADSCLKCHPDIFDREAFSHIIVKHRNHAAANVECGECHLSTKHPKPTVINEEGCLRCHKRLGASGECKACHTPGSIMDERVIPKETLNAFYAGRTSSKKVLVPVGFQHPVGDLNFACMQCHENVNFCRRCHSTATNGIISSPHDANWIPSHGARIFKGELSITGSSGCLKCHDLMYCGKACHTNPGRQKINPNWPLPKIELKE